MLLPMGGAGRMTAPHSEIRKGMLFEGAVCMYRKHMPKPNGGSYFSQDVE